MSNKARFGISAPETKIQVQFTTPATIDFSVVEYPKETPIEVGSIDPIIYESKHINVHFGERSNCMMINQEGRLIFHIKEFGTIKLCLTAGVQEALQRHKYRLEKHFNAAGDLFVTKHSPLAYKVNFTFNDSEFTQKKIQIPAAIFFDCQFQFNKSQNYVGRTFVANSTNLELRFEPGPIDSKTAYRFSATSPNLCTFVFTQLGLLSGHNVDQLYQTFSPETIRSAFLCLYNNMEQTSASFNTQPPSDLNIETWSISVQPLTNARSVIVDE